MGRTKWFLSAMLVLVGLVSMAAADVKLPCVFGDHMVLQREMALPVWGWADAGEKVTVTLAEQSKTATADAEGRWSIKLDAVKAGGPYTLKVQGKNTLEKTDVLVGEVWLCSGQSNMAMTVNSSANKDAEVAAANYPQIRMMTVARETADQPQTDCKGDWQIASPQTVGNFSAAGYFFGRELHKELGVPVGLINSSWGGTPVQAWTCRKLQASTPELQPLVENFEKAAAGYDAEQAKVRFEKQLENWKQAAAKAKQEGKQAPRRPQAPLNPRQSPNSPGTLYNGMITPLVPYALRGAIWYQGESNAGNAKLYGLQLSTMIGNWRKDWNQGDFPFLFVQLPNYQAAQQTPSEAVAGWPLIREQFVQTLQLPNTGMAITIDVGEAGDIHPKNKQDVGKRLAQWALAKTYGKPVVASGPIYKSMQKEGGTILLSFDYADGGLVAKDGGKVKGFAIAGEDKNFVWADAKIEGDKIVVSSPEVKSPVVVRYAWANNPEVNLYNKAGLPVSPFRTDKWEE